MTNRKQMTRSSHHIARDRGAVLIFAIIVLAILFVLASTFMVVARQARTSSSNSANSEMAHLASSTAINEAVGYLRRAQNASCIYTPEGTYDSSKANYLNTDRDPLDLTANAISPLRHFAADPAETEFALLFRDTAGDYNDSTTSIVGSPPPAFTNWPIACNTYYPSGQAVSSKGVIVEDVARRQVITSVPETALPASRLIQARTKIGAVRGDYFVWVRDLDARMYAVGLDLGIDTKDTIDLSLVGSPAYADDTEWGQQAGKGIMQYLTDYGSVNHASSGWPHPTAFQGLQLTAPDVNNLGYAFPKGMKVPDYPSMALLLESCTTTTDVSYKEARGALEYYFNIYRDDPIGGKTIKNFPTALNINTAPREIIAAALSQIPADNPTDVADLTLTLGTKLVGAPPESLAWILAGRIVDKRPFLCRMDFEDFLAAQMVGLKDDTAPAYTQPTDPIPIDTATVPANPSYVWMIAYGITKRWGPGHELAATIPECASPELSVAAYLEMPITTTVPPNPIYDGAGAVNLPANQKKRFDYFFAGSTAESRITPREFNNLINSIDNANYIDDVQLVPLNDDVFEGDIIIEAGPNQKLDVSVVGDDKPALILGPGSTTIPVNDDVVDAFTGYIMPGANNLLDTAPDYGQGDTLAIVDGGNLIAETALPKGKPSYYSYIDDATYADAVWTNASATMAIAPADEIAAVKRMKFYYRLTWNPMSIPPNWNPAEIKDLKSWRCDPDVGSDRKAGFFQMTFDDWNTPYGPMQCGADQATGFPEDYAAAKATSGLAGNGDVSWSPQFAFRSRYFGIYVLGRGLLQKNDLDTNPRITGESRMEAVYDALNDTIMYTRSQLSEKRALGEP